jgi:hypothetical protein
MSTVFPFTLPWKRPLVAVEPAGKLLDLNEVKPDFMEGPYIKVGERGIFAEAGGEQVLVGMSFSGMGASANPAKAAAQANLFVASTSLFEVTLAAARLADQAHKLSDAELRERVAALGDPAEVALMRATGLLG